MERSAICAARACQRPEKASKAEEPDVGRAGVCGDDGRVEMRAGGAEADLRESKG